MSHLMDQTTHFHSILSVHEVTHFCVYESIDSLIFCCVMRSGVKEAIIFGHVGVKKVIFTKKASSPTEYVTLTMLTRDLCICISLMFFLSLLLFAGRFRHGRGRVVIIRRTQTAVPSQFEPPTSPIISQDCLEQRPHDFPPTYEAAEQYHQWQLQQQRLMQQQMMQQNQLQQQQWQVQQQQPGAYVKAMQGWEQQQLQATGGSTPTVPPSSNPQQPAYQQPINVANSEAANPQQPAYQQPINVANSEAVSSGMLLDVTSLPCASATSPEPANK